MATSEPNPLVTSNSWEKLLQRWVDIPVSGEVKLICAILAQCILDEKKSSVGVKYQQGVFAPGGTFDCYCRLLGLNPQFVREQIDRLAEYHATQR